LSAAAVLFPLGGPRLSTILGIAVFLTLAIARGDREPALACVAWLFGFEAIFQATILALGRTGVLGPLHSFAYLVVAAILLPWITRAGVKPSRRAVGVRGVGCRWLPCQRERTRTGRL
jgi:hypothetical protein